MSLTEAIAAAKSAGNTSSRQIYDWLLGTTETLVDNGATITHSQIVELLGLQATTQLLVGLKTRAATNPIAETILTLLTTGGYIRPGTSDIQNNLAFFVTDELLTLEQANILRGAGFRYEYRYELYGLPNLPTIQQIQGAM
jgi:hypothetical protein